MYVISKELAMTKICPHLSIDTESYEKCITCRCIAWTKWHYEEWETGKPEGGYCALIHNRN